MDRPRPAGTERRRDRCGPRCLVSLDVRESVRDRQRGARCDGNRHEDREDRWQRAGGPEPAEDGQDRDADGERQPRPGGALEQEVVGKADPDDRDERVRPSAPPEALDSTSPTPKPATATARATGVETRRAGMGLPGLCPASRGASTMSFVAPMPNWSAVIASPSLKASIGGAPARYATAPETIPSRIDGNG